jgi:Na+/glutamate symporter
MKIASGYVVEIIVWEALWFSLFILSSCELYLHYTKPHLQKRVKVLQKVWFPSGFVSGLICSLLGLDARGIFGVQTRIPVILRMLLWMCGPIPLICCSLVWMQQLFLTVAKTLSYEGPLQIGQDERLQKKVLTFFIVLCFVCCITTAIVMALTNSLRSLTLIFAYGILVSCFAALMSYQTRSVVIETLQTTAGSLKSSSNQNDPQQDSDQGRQRKDLLRKLTLGIIISVVMVIVCAAGLVFYLSPLGWNERLDTIISANPEVYSPTLIFFLYCSLACVGLVSVGVSGILCFWSEGRKEFMKNPSTS